MGKGTILVVDDEVGFLYIMTMILPKEGYHVLTASDGDHGMELIRTERPDLVLLDDMMPGLSGGDICLRVKTDPALAPMTVILYSAGPRVRDTNFVRNIGADAVLYKPFKPTEVVSAINGFLSALA